MSDEGPSGTGSRRRRFGSGDALLAISILLPAILFALASYRSYNEISREAWLRIDRTVRVLREHSIKVFETHALVVEHIRDRQRSIDPGSATDQQQLHTLLVKLQKTLDQVATISIVDRDGMLLVSSRIFPIETPISYADRDWFAAARDADGDRIVVARSVFGRQSNLPVFNLAAKSYSPDGSFAGVISVSVDRGYFERFYGSIEPDFDSSVTLARQDGEVLARFPENRVNLLAESSEFRRQMAARDSGLYETTSRSDAVDRMFGFGRVGDYPVFVRFGITREEALAPWRQNLLAFGGIAILASLTLLGVSVFAIRQGQRERLATQRWRDAAAALELQAESREVVEEQLRHSQKMEAIGQLTGGIAHDFNNLLTGIVGSLDLLAKRLRQGRTQDVERYLKAAIGSANRAASLTHRLLAFARRQPLAPESVDVNELVVSLDDLLRRTLGEAVGLRIITVPGVWPVLCDPHQLENAIINLAINARDAMPGGGRLTITATNVRLDEGEATHPDFRPGAFVRLAVADTGIGMSPDVLARAFEPFFTTKPLGQGTGLGLSMIYGFAHQSGGHVEIRSEEGDGTTISIFLPRSRHEAIRRDVADRLAAGAPEQERRTETVLVVEDEAVVRDVVLEVIADLGLRTLQAVDGPSGLAVLRSNVRIDLLVSDVGLPGFSGRQMTKAARDMRPDLKVLFITGYAEEAASSSGFLEPGMELISKPFTAEALGSRISAMLAG